MARYQKSIRAENPSLFEGLPAELEMQGLINQQKAEQQLQSTIGDYANLALSFDKGDFGTAQRIQAEHDAEIQKAADLAQQGDLEAFKSQIMNIRGKTKNTPQYFGTGDGTAARGTSGTIGGGSSTGYSAEELAQMYGLTTIEGQMAHNNYIIQQGMEAARANGDLDAVDQWYEVIRHIDEYRKNGGVNGPDGEIVILDEFAPVASRRDWGEYVNDLVTGMNESGYSTFKSDGKYDWVTRSLGISEAEGKRMANYMMANLVNNSEFLERTKREFMYDINRGAIEPGDNIDKTYAAYVDNKAKSIIDSAIEHETNMEYFIENRRVNPDYEQSLSMGLIDYENSVQGLDVMSVNMKGQKLTTEDYDAIVNANNQLGQQSGDLMRQADQITNALITGKIGGIQVIPEGVVTKDANGNLVIKPMEGMNSDQIADIQAQIDTANEFRQQSQKLQQQAQFSNAVIESVHQGMQQEGMYDFEDEWGKWTNSLGEVMSQQEFEKMLTANDEEFAQFTTEIGERMGSHTSEYTNPSLTNIAKVSINMRRARSQYQQASQEYITEFGDTVSGVKVFQPSHDNMGIGKMHAMLNGFVETQGDAHTAFQGMSDIHGVPVTEVIARLQKKEDIEDISASNVKVSLGQINQDAVMHVTMLDKDGEPHTIMIPIRGNNSQTGINSMMDNILRETAEAFRQVNASNSHHQYENDELMELTGRYYAGDKLYVNGQDITTIPNFNGTFDVNGNNYMIQNTSAGTSNLYTQIDEGTYDILHKSGMAKKVLKKENGKYYVGANINYDAQGNAQFTTMQGAGAVAKYIGENETALDYNASWGNMYNKGAEIRTEQLENNTIYPGY
jgi:hypothetical protein